MNQAILDRIAASKPSRPTRDKSRRHDVPALPPLPATVRRRGPAWLQFAVAAALVLGLVGAAYGGGLIGGSSGKQPTSIPAVLGSNNATATAAPAPSPASVAANVSANFRGGAARTGEMPGPAPVGAPELVWKNNIGLTDRSSPVVDGGRVFVLASSAGSGAKYSSFLKAVDLKTGNDVWSVNVDAAPTAFDDGPAAANGLVYVVTTEGVVGFNEADGTIAWSYLTDNQLVGAGSPALDGSSLYLLVGDSTLRSLNAKTGAENWRVSVPGQGAGTESSFFVASVTAAKGIVYAATQQGLVFAADARDGHKLWQFQAKGGIHVAPMVYGGVLYIASIVFNEGEAGTPGRLSALDAKTGKQLWAPKVFSSSFTMAAGNGMIFLDSATPDGMPLTALEANTGKQRWTGPVAEGLFAPVFADGVLFASGSDGGIQKLDPATGEMSSSVFLNYVSDPAVIDGLLVASSYDTLFAIGGIDQPGADSVADFSGLPPCSPPTAVPTNLFTGKPKYTIGVETQLKARPGKGATWEDGRDAYFTEFPQLLADNVLTGPKASSAQIDGILSTFKAMGDCSARVDGQIGIQGFFTADFFRRRVAKAGPNGYALTWPYQPGSDELNSMTTIRLEDGRVAIELHAQSDNAPYLLIIFNQQNDIWMIDEVYKIVDQYNWSQLG
jgi:outer membrane protein assembly factor BamB